MTQEVDKFPYMFCQF